MTMGSAIRPHRVTFRPIPYHGKTLRQIMCKSPTILAASGMVLASALAGILHAVHVGGTLPQ
jgi:hypothetical protein